METMKYLIIDQELYLIKEQDLRKVYEAEGHCCGSCNEYTLQNLREPVLDELWNEVLDDENKGKRQAHLQCWDEMQQNKKTCGFCVEPASKTIKEAFDNIRKMSETDTRKQLTMNINNYVKQLNVLLMLITTIHYVVSC